VIHLGLDPLYARYPIRGFPSDVAIAGAPRLALPKLGAAMQVADGIVAERRDALAQRRAAMRAGWKRLRDEMATQTPIHPSWVSHCLSEARDPHSILVNEYTLLNEHCPSTEPGGYYGSSPAAGLGWGAGAALGVKLAKPDRQVISILGDGSYIFSNPVAVHHASTMHKLPVLTIVINNAMWGAVRRATLGMYPDGEAAKSNKPPFIDLDDLPAFETICEASGGYGERVEDPAALPGAMKRALKAVDGGKQALLNVISRGGAGG
jgi:acetolactate synthase-1/2/3 large subunit